MIVTREASITDQEPIWQIIQQVIAAGDTYVFAPDSAKEKMLGYWFAEGTHTYVATIDGAIKGTFLIRNNQPALGSHIANAAYMVLPAASGQGIGKAMGLFSLEEARRLGYRAMQFNFVIKTNETAIRLWQKMGFTIIGEIPEAFQHQQKGLVNALILYKKLD